MKEKEYQLVGWAIFLVTVIIALSWCLNESGLTGWLIRASEKLIEVRLVQISWLITIILICLPGYMAKRYFDNLAWNEHIKHMPRPNIHESAKRSKYIQVDSPPPSKPVELGSLPKNLEEFILTCVHCGHFFSAKKSEEELKCPQCGESIQLET
jgi:hypothetical protein